MTISIIGTGYVGLVTGAVFADFGHQVFCVDIIKEKIDSLKKGEIPFYEPGLEELVKRNIAQKRLFFTTNYATSIPKSKVVFICVGTPPKENGEADLSCVYSATKETAKYLRRYTLIAIKSTVPIGVETDLKKVISQITKVPFEFASCPEFLREGSAVKNAVQPDRIVIGTQSQKAADILLDLYKHFNGQRVVCGLGSAQMIKYVANSFLATKISFANAIANLCDKLGADAEVVLHGVGLDQRIGRTFLYPGVGYGGSCFPKDVSAFAKIAQKTGSPFKLLDEVNLINKNQAQIFVDKVANALKPIKGKTVTVLGLSFKPNTDDIREAPSLKIIKKLLDLGAKVKAYDPQAIKHVKKIFAGKIEFSENPYQALEESEALLLITEWNEFKELDLLKIKKIMKQPIIIDGRNIYDPTKVKTLGFLYRGIGRN